VSSKNTQKKQGKNRGRTQKGGRKLLRMLHLVHSSSKTVFAVILIFNKSKQRRKFTETFLTNSVLNLYGHFYEFLMLLIKILIQHDWTTSTWKAPIFPQIYLWLLHLKSHLTDRCLTQIMPLEVSEFWHLMLTQVFSCYFTLPYSNWAHVRNFENMPNWY